MFCSIDNVTQCLVDEKLPKVTVLKCLFLELHSSCQGVIDYHRIKYSKTRLWEVAGDWPKKSVLAKGGF